MGKVEVLNSAEYELKLEILEGMPICPFLKEEWLKVMDHFSLREWEILLKNKSVPVPVSKVGLFKRMLKENLKVADEIKNKSAKEVWISLSPYISRESLKSYDMVVSILSSIPEGKKIDPDLLYYGIVFEDKKVLEEFLY